MTDQSASALPQPVLVVGTGLLGTSVGMALRRRGIEVLLTDRNPEHLRTATGLGAGHVHQPAIRRRAAV